MQQGAASETHGASRRGRAPTDSPTRIQNPGRPDAIRWLRLAIVLAALVPLAWFLVTAWMSYRAAYDETQRRSVQVAQIAHEHASRVFEANDVIARYVLSVLGDEDDEQVRAREETLHRRLRTFATGLAQVGTIQVWSADGQMLVGSHSYPADRHLDVRDREYFREHRTSKSDRHVSGMLTGRRSGAPFIDVSVRRTLSDGSFAGLVSTTIRPSYFTDFYRSLAEAEPGLSLSILRHDGLLLARWPSSSPDVLAIASAAPMRAEMAHNLGSGTADAGSLIDGKRRLLAYRKLDSYPVYVVAGIEHRQLMANWLRSTAGLAVFMLVASLALGFVSWVAMRRTRRELLTSERLKRESEHRLQAESALRQAQKLEALGQLTGGVAHDFNNLLMVVNNNLHLLSRLVPQTAGSPQIAAIDRAVASGTRLTRQLLAFSRRQAVTPEVIAINDAVPAMMDLLRTSLGSSIRVRFVAEAEPSWVKVDAAEFELALLNLTINAREAMKGGGEFTIRTRNVRIGAPSADLAAGPYVVLSASDTGEGVPPDVLGRVFEPFFTTRMPGQGTGLGLSQVYGFCVQAGGVARMESETGRGTRVSLYLPQAVAAVGGPAAPSEPAVGRLRGRLLLVEDNLEVAAATKPLLEALGCSVLHVASADAALDALGTQGQRFDVVLSDIMMPGSLNGLDLALMLRHQHPGLPVLLMTGYAAQTGQAMASGFQVLAKPVSAAALAAAIGGTLQARRGMATTAS
jgi:two-component system NtrC family sensor kinase